MVLKDFIKGIIFNMVVYLNFNRLGSAWLRQIVYGTIRLGLYRVLFDNIKAKKGSINLTPSSINYFKDNPLFLRKLHVHYPQVLLDHLLEIQQIYV